MKPKPSDLDAELHEGYQSMAHITRHMDNLDDISALWMLFSKICDRYAEMLDGTEFYERAINLKNKCLRLADLHSGEIPNETTIRAIEAGRRGEVFTPGSVEQLMKDLNEDDLTSMPSEAPESA